MNVFIFYSENPEMGMGGLSAGPGIVWIDQFMNMYGYDYACIHPEDADYKAFTSKTYATLDDAMKDHTDKEWIFIDPTADGYLEEIDHIESKVYVVGHDGKGFHEGVKGRSAKLRIPSVGHALPCLIAAASDRWSRTWQ